jgi:putative isomerase
MRTGEASLNGRSTEIRYAAAARVGWIIPPRFDAATRLDAVDFNSFFSLECQVMAGFAHGLGLTDDAAKWMNRHMKMNRLIAARLWSDEVGFFVDYDTERRAPSPVLASSGFLPLICGAASKAQATRLAECLTDPTMFGTAFPVPSIAARDTQHYAKDMWRGPVWININWMIARGFERYGFDGMAARLGSRTMHEIEDAFEKYGVFFEYYDDRGEVPPSQLRRKGKCAPDMSPYHQVFHDYGWTASLYVDLAYTGDHSPTGRPNRVTGD